METQNKINEFVVPVHVRIEDKIDLILAMALRNLSVVFTEYGNSTIVSIVR